jgi:predicted phosphodiesterase
MYLAKYMKFQYFSDLHLNFYGKEWKRRIVINPQAEILIVAGDICSPYDKEYENFISHVSSLFKYVIIISGNHEYYRPKKNVGFYEGDWMEIIDNMIRCIIDKYDNVKYLQNSSFDVPDTDITIYGTTLWSNIYQRELPLIYDMLTDYSDRYGIPDFTCEKSIQMFEHNREMLDKFLLESRNRKVIVVTHHLPSYKLISPKYMSCGINSAFASQIDISQYVNIYSWIAGHTHTPVESDIYHVNPVGYPKENMNVNTDKIISII